MTLINPRFPKHNADRVRAYCNALIDEVVNHAEAIDFDAADLRFAHANGDTVSSWVARRGGLTATATGTPEFRVPTSDMPEPSVYFAASGELLETPATIDWSTYDVATMIASSSSAVVSGVARGFSLAAGTGSIGDTAGRGLGVYRVDSKVTGLVYTAGASAFYFERDNDTDPANMIGVGLFDISAGTPTQDQVRLWVEGVEESGAGNGETSNIGNTFQSTLRLRLGAQDTAGTDGIDGKIARAIVSPQDIGDAGVAAVTAALQAIRDTWPR